ncbi:hypothetical protein [Novosphingobium sp.]|jgi:hypothetical protein|uniref:hypothetical protein n=1 Tax=Novosphingobium sp. TaxID=1874826 RepID=UPI002FE1431D
MKKFALAALMVFGEPASAQEFAREGTWTIKQVAGRCTLSQVLQHDDDRREIFNVYYDAREKNVLMTFSSTLTTSLPSEGMTKLHLDFSSKGVLDDGWGERDFSYRLVPDTDMHMFSTLFAGSSAVSDFFQDLAKSDFVGVRYGVRAVAGSDLRGSSSAIASLRKCAFQAAGLDPRDPFAQ